MSKNKQRRGKPIYNYVIFCYGLFKLGFFYRRNCHNLLTYSLTNTLPQETLRIKS